MADSTEEVQTAPEIEGQAAGGLMSVIQTYLPAATAAGNATRAAAYQNLLDLCQEMRTLLNNIDPQADAAVLTAVNATLATI